LRFISLDKQRFVQSRRRFCRSRTTAHQNECTPYRAAGHFHTYPAHVTLSEPRVCKWRTVFLYIAWHFWRTKPTGVPGSGGLDCPC